MDSEDSVREFHREGATSLTSIYHFNALAISALAPKECHIVDLGSGSGQFLAYLASRRPDLSITGVDLSANMVRVGNLLLGDAGLQGRVRLIEGDMRTFRRAVTRPVGLISSIFALHHLPTSEDLSKCLDEVGAAISEHGAALWIFDHVRPFRRISADEFPAIFTPAASRVFQEDSRNSLCASWSFDELGTALRGAIGDQLKSAQSRLLSFYQAHWLLGAEAPAEPSCWSDDQGFKAAAEAQALARLFASLPKDMMRPKAV